MWQGDRPTQHLLAVPNAVGTSFTPSDQQLEPLLEFEIKWLPEGQLRARRIVSRSRAIATGKSQSLTLGRPTHWESDVECDGQKLVDACRAANVYGEQPCTIHYRVPSGVFRHVPDLLVHGIAPRPWLVEFKRDDDSELAAAYHREALLSDALAQAGYDYRVVLGSTLREYAYLENAKWLLRYGRRATTLTDFERARALSERTGSLQFGQFMRGFANQWQARRLASRLLLDGHLAMDMHLPIDDRTVLTWLHEPDPDGGASWLRAAFGVTR